MKKLFKFLSIFSKEIMLVMGSCIILIAFTYLLISLVKSPWPIDKIAVNEGQKLWMLVRVIETRKYHPVYDGFGHPIKKYQWYRRYKENAQLFPLPTDTVLLQTNAISGIIVRSQIVIGANNKVPIEAVYAEVLCY